MLPSISCTCHIVTVESPLIEHHPLCFSLVFNATNQAAKKHTQCALYMSIDLCENFLETQVQDWG